MSDSEPRTYAEIADHARIVQEELSIAQGDGYIRPVEHPDDSGIHPSLPGFKTQPVSHGSRNLSSYGERVHATSFSAACDHIRFLENVVERLACQVAELAERLDASD